MTRELFFWKSILVRQPPPPPRLIDIAGIIYSLLCVFRVFYFCFVSFPWIVPWTLVGCASHVGPLHGGTWRLLSVNSNWNLHVCAFVDFEPPFWFLVHHASRFCVIVHILGRKWKFILGPFSQYTYLCMRRIFLPHGFVVFHGLPLLGLRSRFFCLIATFLLFHLHEFLSPFCFRRALSRCVLVLLSFWCLTPVSSIPTSHLRLLLFLSPIRSTLHSHPRPPKTLIPLLLLQVPSFPFP